VGIREEMPLIAKAVGVWEGTYQWLDADNRPIECHKSRLTCRLVEREGRQEYHQTNEYTWDDGRTERIEFPSRFEDKQLWFDTERIKGRAWEADQSTILLTWVRKDNPQGYFYEMINFCGDERKYRVWQFYEQGRLTKRCLINELRVSFEAP